MQIASISNPTLPPRAGFVATLGRPNAGKSTLLNHLLGEHLALVSHKANATRKQLQLIVPYKPLNAQIIFVDTPGIHHQEKLLNQYMLSQALKAMGDCDLALYLAPVSDDIRHYEHFLELYQGKHILLLSKIDTCTNEQILCKITQYQRFSDTFLELLPVSVKRGFDKEMILRTIASHLPFSPFLYDEELLCNVSLKEIYKEMIRQSLFENLSDEIPYEADVVIKTFEEGAEQDRIFAHIIVEKSSQKGVVIGKGGSGIKRISKCAREKIQSLSTKAIFLKLDVEVYKGWSKQRETLKKIGYDFTL
ncbi:GTPase Era [Helicobacter sp. MIT 21-1697]|uniref:GTPase Era n=1 Tax=Helicobacter sp. MIT 21-1697 TaxID=2993733 RepID=UPI00224B588A|nr:GTPase Era [Helicobacter sp. MIT 21-1697]MCX2717360.1 GTPase Era [Helicobacter sp. MIT 21-1697]